MRRLATQNRGGAVGSQRDYQTIINVGKPLCFSPENDGYADVSVKYMAEERVGRLTGAGCYLASDADVELTVTISASPSMNLLAEQTVLIESQRYWTRLGILWEEAGNTTSCWIVRLKWKSPSQLYIWGLNCAILSLPLLLQEVISQKGRDKVLKPIHLPEALYLAHDSGLCSGEIESVDNVTYVESSREIPGKKCCQCQRYLPIDPRLAAQRAANVSKQRAPQSMVIAFHGHRSKKSGYQNECRACKKFEINDHFNPIRTSDQHHESSILTRERKLLLRDGDIVEHFKERGSKEGFRTHIWKRFGGHCFKCGNRVTVEEYQLDHTRPLSYLWPLDEHATCLCADCNNNKKDSFPVEFYSREELKRLSATVNLSLELLEKRTVNEAELQRIRSDIVAFANSWDPRLFESVATRVADVHPEIDLYKELQASSPELFATITQELQTRPPALLDDPDELSEGEDGINVFKELGMPPLD